MYSLIAVSLAVAASSLANNVEVGYAPQTLVAAQQYSVNRENFMRGDALKPHGHVRAGESELDDGSEFERDVELSSSEINDNAATSSLHYATGFIMLLAAGSVWAAAF